MAGPDDDIDVPTPPAAQSGEGLDKAIKKREDELMDEALKESFPASDPPSAKHIT